MNIILRKSAIILCATAAVWGGAAAKAGQRLDAEYGFYWKGILVASAETGTLISDTVYDLSINFRIRGIAKLFASGRSAVTAQGRMGTNGVPVPTRYTSDGRWDGEDYAQTMIFDENGALAQQKLEWPEKWLEEFKREPVPEDMQVGPDPASMVIQLINTPITAASDGTPLALRTFDGDTVIEWHVSCSPEMTVLEESGKSPFAGEAHECGFSSTLVAGKRILTEKQKKKAEKRRKKAEKRRAAGKEDKDEPPRIWVQPVADGKYFIPVRAEMSSGMGRVVMYLKDLTITDMNDAARAGSSYVQSDTTTESQP